MSLVFAWILALAAPPSASPTAIDIGPPLVRRMGLQITVRRAGDDPVTHRPVEVLEVPPAVASDDSAPPIHLDLPPGEYLLEVEGPGFLPSTRALTLGADGPATVTWELLPDSAHQTVRFPIVGTTGDPIVRLTARHLADDQPAVLCLSRRAPCELRLRRGPWTLEAAAAGYRPLRRVFNVGDAERQSIDLSLEPVTADRPPSKPPAPTAPTPAPRNSRRLVLGLSLAAVPLVAAGIPLTIFGPLRYRQWRGHLVCDSYDADCADAIIPPIHLGAAGAGMLGAALGLGVASVTAARAKGSQAWWAELGLGSALALAGGSWLVSNSILLDRDLKTGPLDEIDARNGRRPVSTLLLGAGLGLVGGSLTGLLLRRPARLSPYGAPSQAGLLLAGEF